MPDFDHEMNEYQVAWRRGRVSTDEYGTQNGRAYPWILPPAAWEEGLWPGSARELVDYLAREKVAKHTGAHNLKSSWICCANLYFPFRSTEDGRALLAGFLQHAVSEEIVSVDGVELEYAEPGGLHPSELLGETGGARGSGQTSPDVAFLVNGGKGIVLTESKFTEHSFYRCSARSRTGSPERPGNPDPERCMNAGRVSTSPGNLCHQVAWGRKYWERLGEAIDLDIVAQLKGCPAALGGYQLFRQQALAEGYAESEKYRLVVSAVAYDARNETLLKSLETTGIARFPQGWARLFKGKARFTAWTHQTWVDWVRRHHAGRWGEWLTWIEARYGYPGG